MEKNENSCLVVNVSLSIWNYDKRSMLQWKIISISIDERKISWLGMFMSWVLCSDQKMLTEFTKM